jgi:hypothetical protein
VIRVVSGPPGSRLPFQQTTGFHTLAMRRMSRTLKDQQRPNAKRYEKVRVPQVRLTNRLGWTKRSMREKIAST